MSRIESGAIRVSAERLAAIAKALGATAEQLMDEAREARLRAAAEGIEPNFVLWKEPDVSPQAPTSTVGLAVAGLLAGPQGRDNYQRRRRIEQQVQEHQERTAALLARLQDVQREVVTEVLTPFIEQAARIERTLPSMEVPSVDPGRSPVERLESHKEVLSHDLLETAALMGAAVRLGATAGSGAAAAVMALVGRSATASTGTAICSLTGAAATRATLAWLGGGSLAAGGFGVAGGALVLSSIATLPALVAAGGVLAFQGRKKRREAVAEADRLTEAERALEESKPVLARVWELMDRERRVLENLMTRGLREVRWLAREAEADEMPLAWERREEAFRVRFDALTQLVATTTAVLALPVVRDLDPEAAADEDRTERDLWIETVLSDAERFVDAE